MGYNFVVTWFRVGRLFYYLLIFSSRLSQELKACGLRKSLEFKLQEGSLNCNYKFYVLRKIKTGVCIKFYTISHSLDFSTNHSVEFQHVNPVAIQYTSHLNSSIM